MIQQIQLLIGSDAAIPTCTSSDYTYPKWIQKLYPPFMFETGSCGVQFEEDDAVCNYNNKGKLLYHDEVLEVCRGDSWETLELGKYKC